MIENSIVKRRSVREFKADMVNDKLIQEILEAAIFAPSAMSNHALEFIIIKKPEIKTKLFEAQTGGRQDFLTTAPIIVAIITNTNKTECPVQDIAVASENLMLQAAALNLGSVWKNVDKNYKIEVKKILNIPEMYEIINLICLGYPKNKISPHQKNDYELKIHRNNFA